MGLYEERIFPWILDKTDSPVLKKLRRAVVQDVAGEVLEIGLGTGLTLQYYPEAVRTVHAVEPSSGSHPRAHRRAKEAGITLELQQLAGERLPYEDARFDCVVITLVLCTAEDVPALLAEAARVLKPGGALHFLEHVRSDDPKLQRWQERLNGISRVIGCGCNITRDTERVLRDSIFTVETLQHKLYSGFDALYPLIFGVARRPA